MTNVRTLIVRVGVALLVCGFAARNAAAQSSTMVTPPGEPFTVSLATGNSAGFSVAGCSVTCNKSTASGAVPAAPDNYNPTGPVSGLVTPPTFTNGTGATCPTSVAFTTATTTTNSTNGPWRVSLQYSASGSTATLTIPKAGAIAKTSGLASCTVTFAPNASYDIVGSWSPGSGSTPEISFSTTIPISVSGGIGCPTSATSASFSARYTVASANPPILVGP